VMHGAARHAVAATSAGSIACALGHLSAMIT